MIITGLSVQAKNKSRVNLSLDGEFRCGLEKVSAAKHRLAVGGELSEEDLQKILLESEAECAFNRAANYLAPRRRTVKEIERYLVGKGFALATIQKTVEKLKEYRYLSDEDFVSTYIKEYGRKYGAAKIRFELGRLGIDKQLIYDALKEFEPDDEELMTLAQKRCKTADDIDRFSAYLQRQGHDYETVKRVRGELRERFGKEGEDD